MSTKLVNMFDAPSNHTNQHFLTVSKPLFLKLPYAQLAQYPLKMLQVNNENAHLAPVETISYFMPNCAEYPGFYPRTTS